MKTKLLAGILGAVGLTGSVSAQAYDYDCPMGGMTYGLYGGYGTGMMIFSWVISLAVLALVIAGIYWFIKTANKK